MDKYGNAITRFNDSKLAYSLLIGGGLGSVVYIAISLALGFFKFSGLAISFLVVSCAVFASRMFLEGLENWLTSGLFGTRRGTPINETERNGLLDQIEKMDRAGDYAKANNVRKQLLESGLAERPAALVFEIARIYDEKANRPEDALYWYRKCQTIGENAFNHAAQEAIDRLHARGKVSDSEHSNRIAQARQAVKEGDLDKSQQLVDELLRLFPEQAEPLFLAGQIAAKREFFPRAASYFEQAQQIDPDSELIAFSLATAYSNAQQYPEARHAWRTYLERFAEKNEKNAALASEALSRVEAFLKTDLEMS